LKGVSPLSIKVWFFISILFDLYISATDPGTDTWCTVDPKAGAQQGEEKQKDEIMKRSETNTK
jgi:hypothetical protein